MPAKKYDWREADKRIRWAVVELFAAQRHCNHRKRVNILNDLIAAEQEIQNARAALRGGDEGRE